MVFINADTIKAELLGVLQLIKVAVVEVLPFYLAPIGILNEKCHRMAASRRAS